LGLSAAWAISALSSIVGSALAQIAFVDHTAESGLIAKHDPSTGMILAGNIIATMASGGVVGDFDNDGFQDVFVVSGGKLPDRLFINNGDGTFTDRASQWGVDVKHMGISAAVGDYDGDGWLDIFVTSCGPDGAWPGPGHHRLYRNTGLGYFVEVAQAAGVSFTNAQHCDEMGATFCDYDLDGDLDLFVTAWVAASNGDRLFRNNGNGTFTDVTGASGVAAALASTSGFSPRFVDMDGDRHPELLLVADFHTSRYLVNNGDGTFTNATASSGTGGDDNGMGCAIGDFDGDGRLDWFVTSIYASGSPRSPGTGNRLYRNLGEHRFDDVTLDAGVIDGNWGWGASAVDIDHDGDLDIVQTNGWPTSSLFTNQPTRVWLNDGAGHFVDVAPSSGLWHLKQGRGLLTFDADNDGDRDAIIFANRDFLSFYRNELVPSSEQGWLDLRFDTSANRRLAPRGVGTVVHAHLSDRVVMRHLDGGSNYSGQDQLSIHIGLGAERIVPILRVAWPDGTVTVLRDVEACQRIVVAAGQGPDLDADGSIGPGDLAILLGAWGQAPLDDPRDLTADGIVDGADLAVLLSNWDP
jgi:hypothetical protein